MRRPLYLLAGVVIFATFTLLVIQVNRPTPVLVEHAGNQFFASDVPYSAAAQKYIQEKGIVQSREYSAKVEKNTLQPRSFKIARIIDIIRDAGNLKGFVVKPTISMRVETGFPDFRKICQFQGVEARNMRMRDYIVGDEFGFATFDMKMNWIPKTTDDVTSELKKLADERFAVNSSLISHKIIDKLEEDYHTCSSKYSREVRLKVQASEIKTCKDVQRYLPEVRAKNPNGVLEVGPPALWWVMKHEFLETVSTPYGEFPVKVESTFTLQYTYVSKTNAEQILNGELGELTIPSAKSEWSFRVYASNLGFGYYNEHALNIFTEKFLNILSELNKAGYVTENESC